MTSTQSDLGNQNQVISGNQASPSISGFTFIRNGVELGFPFEASIRSLLPLVDEFVVAVGKGSDDTVANKGKAADGGAGLAARNDLVLIPQIELC